MDKIEIRPIGKVRESKGGYLLEIFEPYWKALEGLDKFSHVKVFWWAHMNDTPELREIVQVDLPYAPGERAGVFACRSERRPNPVAVTTCGIIQVDVKAGMVIFPWIDAFDGTPVIDLKPFIPTSDRVRDYRVAPWLAEWPEWMEDAGAYFAEHAVDFGD